jgi:hypothetical protein
MMPCSVTKELAEVSKLQGWVAAGDTGIIGRRGGRKRWQREGFR